ncbi:succinyl-CoA ligase subunit alpha [Coccidioides immitis H538.4]|uniref:Succinyl-CoA ligase subunit alpha n=3 Tax=Coccidioides immitis TaxID=5501 RepID=A0A0J8R8H4_COCIT|nr:succinyl-CoA ligase subunit alpha [Coccidioides immitis RMSCC 2394]KMU80043.1 succinyl-CoA ligase subunit alpha [Coccidioides immitis RMSCC 3703]KMU86236.1 succinyl-CoA ligase subunit alpha [Coccidioides immitis H538.4]
MAGAPRFNAIRPSRLHTPTNRYRSRFVTAKNSNAAFSTTSRLQSYEDTLKNLKIGADTKATANVKESLQWGTKIVGGVKPGVEGEHLGLPVFPSVRVAQEKARPDATAVYVPGNQTAAAIEEAIEAEIPLVVAVAEHVPIHDILRVGL